MKTLYLYLFVFLLNGEFAYAFDPVAAAREIVDTPDWTGLVHEQLSEEGPEIMKVFEKYKNISPQDARKLVIQIKNTADPNPRRPQNRNGKIYIFNRIYCNIPEKLQKGDLPRFGGWELPTEDKQGNYNAMDPLGKKPDGSLFFRTTCGMYMGLEYKGLDEFDYFMKRFGSRYVKEQKIK